MGVTHTATPFAIAFDAHHGRVSSAANHVYSYTTFNKFHFARVSSIHFHAIFYHFDDTLCLRPSNRLLSPYTPKRNGKKKKKCHKKKKLVRSTFFVFVRREISFTTETRKVCLRPKDWTERKVKRIVKLSYGGGGENGNNDNITNMSLSLR